MEKSKKDKMKFKSQLKQIIEDHIYLKRTADDTADRIIGLFVKNWTLIKKFTDAEKKIIEEDEKRARAVIDYGDLVVYDKP